MSIDLSQFHKAFFDEVGAALVNMESLLHCLDVANPDADQIDAICGTARHINGSAGIFGFTDLSRVAHSLENILLRIRGGELALNDEMIDAFRNACGLLRTLLAAHKDERQADRADSESICVCLHDLATSPTLEADTATTTIATTPYQTSLNRG